MEAKKSKMMDPKTASDMVRKIFAEKLREKEEEVDEISQRIKEVQHSLQFVRYGAVTAMSNKTQVHGPQSELFLPSIHPAASMLTRGKRPKVSSSTETSVKVKVEPEEDPLLKAAKPVFVPPKPKPGTETQEPRGAHLKIKRKVIVGNVSKWIPPDDREDMSTHKWMLYVRGDKDHPDISDCVDRVRFLIHESYHPNNLVEVSKSPFQLTRRGWGEFPARVQIFFKNPTFNKPVSIVHNLKLDKTYTGLQTLGAETWAEVWLLLDQEKENKN